MKTIFRLCAFLVLLASSPLPAAENFPKNYIYFHARGENGASIVQDRALLDPRFSGAQIVYTWRELEPEKDRYDFSAIRKDLAYLDSIGRKLWIQLQEKSFTPRRNVPDYLVADPLYKGGVLRQSMRSAPERDPAKAESGDEYGLSAKMWERPVRDRYQKLIRALGREFDGKIEGINFSESSIDVGTENADGSTTFPSDFSPRAYVDAMLDNMRVLAASFTESTPMVYLNFVPDEWLPWDDKGYMRSLFAGAAALNMGVGGPDLMPYRKSHMGQSYGFFKEYPSSLAKGMAVQDGNLEQLNPRTGKKNTVADILDFSQSYLGLDYIFWVEEEPYFTDEVLRQLPQPPEASIQVL